ncbi:ABC transporter substrate-binding protein [Halomonas sp. McH1-25]|uniref:ABC transporter substrate-binding protein n=1 Tax=unclassified Halomonas TaxID=2609666 RepID=UPI001EF62575|nr:MULTISPECIES: ABC transporter substrate-binding protein [unclassified Halomonas]MCG7599259.1 ABC transporter substrate-binding protein [Halomonas sp. McH1-25]MCP1341127.1 ABC transporter substrate-binding protein [Halomonas sp. FL8]MCP1360279.1 ABC transporter substrate-binding protein [Halomonas sp. BBD45]MCP1364243.1 ABC transporter substrate-binding protein [Halomonas sp. BBD48]
MTHPMIKPLLALPLAGAIALPAMADDATLDFGVPAWPGITVKTEIASQLLQPLGYETRSQELGLQVIYQALDTGDIDVFLGGWMPAQQDMLEPREESGDVVRLANNVDGAQMTLAVPDYVYESGVTSFADLDANRERFNGEIYGFGAGSAASEILNEAIDNDTWGLGDWSIVDTSTVGMLSAAEDAISRQEPIVWVGWTPHWMNLELPMRYLDDSKDLFGENNGQSDVLTLMRSGYAEAHPNLKAFFEKFAFEAEEQSWMIQGFGQEERPADEVAKEWIRSNPERVQAMLEGVTTQAGEPAWPAVRDALSL